MSENFKMKYKVIHSANLWRYRIKYQGNYYYFSEKLIKCSKIVRISDIIAILIMFILAMIRSQDETFILPPFYSTINLLIVFVVDSVVSWFIYPKYVIDDLRLIE